MKYEQLMQSLGAHLKLESLVLDQDKNCTLAFDGVQVHFAPKISQSAEVTAQADAIEPTRIVLEAILSSGTVDSLEFQEQMLVANLLGQGAGGAALSMAQDRGVRIRQFLDLPNLQLQQFAKVLESFVNHAEYWQQEINRAVEPKVLRAAPDSLQRHARV